jgi:uncharacterized protein (UPF0128 family)
MKLTVPIKEGFEDQILNYLINHLTGKPYPTEIEVDNVKQPNPLSKEQFAEKALRKFVKESCEYQFKISEQKKEIIVPSYLKE